MRSKDSRSENGLGQVGLMTAAKPLHQLGPTAPKGSLRCAVCCNTMYSLKVYSLLSVDKVKRLLTRAALPTLQWRALCFAIAQAP